MWLPLVKVDRQVGELVEHLGRDAEAAGGVLDVDYDVVDVPAVHQLGQESRRGLSAGLADHVADEQQLHLANSTARVSRITVTLICPG